MPTYDYRCDGCGHTFDAFQSMKDDALTDCPECGQDRLRRLIGAGAGIIFKGSGFYETDYKRSRNSDKSSDKGDSKSESSDAGKSDSPAKSSDSKKSDD